jgi:hypothetical protein
MIDVTAFKKTKKKDRQMISNQVDLLKPILYVIESCISETDDD